jgi:UDP-N-acetylmuramyl pentapeptide phosphotransferase/UDP-N-acetylglucosamine-1-phosphate transferase
LLIGGVWFVNLVNFMDGIDWMTVAEIVPICAALAVFGALGALPPAATLVSFVLCGAMLGFAPFNRPVARLFLGDVGSLPIGLLVAWLLAMLAGNGHLTAALLLPLYHLMDATITLVARLMNGEAITQAHRGHFYQRAIRGSFSVSQVVTRVFLLNVVLIALASATFFFQSLLFQTVVLATGVAFIGLALRHFGRANP